MSYLPIVVDMDAAIGFVVAHGDAVDRARLSWLRTGARPPKEILDEAEMGAAPTGGWPATWGGDVASIDATCFRLSELDDLGALDRPPACRALDWLADRQRTDGMWEEDESLSEQAPPWAKPGDEEARLYLTASAAYWLTVADFDAPAPGPLEYGARGEYAEVTQTAARAVAERVRPDGTWPSFLAAGWLGAAVLHRRDMFYESARIQVVLDDRLPEISPANVAWMAAVLRRVRVATEGEPLLTAARWRLAETQRSDGGWASDDDRSFDVHTTLTAIRACR